MTKNIAYTNVVNILTSQDKFHVSLGLDRVINILELLGNPQEDLSIIHVAGTNGKGSTCAMLSSILTESGYKTGLYTSPHLLEYTERVKINGIDISKENFSRLIKKIIDLINENNIPATEFEILTVLAFEFFKEQNVDYVILETGLGGRLDATNVVKKPLVSIITSIDIDHADRLGNTIEKIAFEKAGIIKQNRPVITLKNNNGLNIISEIAKKNNSSLFFADYSNYKANKSFISTENGFYELPLLGLWQLKNLSLVLKAVEVLNFNNISIAEKAVKNGLKKVKWPGRFQYIEDKNIILDGAHNLAGAIMLRESLDFYFPDQQRIWIYSSLDTKDYNSIIKVLFNENDIIIFTKSCSKNSALPEKLKESAIKSKVNLNSYITNNFGESISLAFSMLSSEIDNKLIIIAGSLYTIGEALTLI